jgi:hypothetical protein
MHTKKVTKLFAIGSFIALSSHFYTSVNFASAAPQKPGKKAAQTQKKDVKTNAQSLLNDARKAVAAIGKEAKAKNLSTKDKKAAPFLTSLKEVSKALEATQVGLTAKSKDFHKNLHVASVATTKTAVTYNSSGLKNPIMTDALKALQTNVDLLRAKYGAEGQRAKKGGQLTAKEEAKLSSIKIAQEQFQAQLLQVKAKSGNNKFLNQGIDEMLKKSKQVTSFKGKPTVDFFLTALDTVVLLAGEYDAYSYYVAPQYRDVWVTLSPLTSSFETVYFETYDVLDIPGGYDYYTIDTEISADYDLTVDSISDAEVDTFDAYVDNLDTVETGDDVGEYYSEDISYEEQVETDETITEEEYSEDISEVDESHDADMHEESHDDGSEAVDNDAGDLDADDHDAGVAEDAAVSDDAGSLDDAGGADDTGMSDDAGYDAGGADDAGALDDAGGADDAGDHHDAGGGEE